MADLTARERARRLCAVFNQEAVRDGLCALKVCIDCNHIEAAILEAERAAVASVLKRLGDEDVRREAAYALHEGEAPRAIDALAAVRALLEKEMKP